MKNLLIISSLMFFLNAFTQKPSIKSHKIKINTNRQDYLKKINTFSYEIQDDGAFWNYIPDEDDNYQFEIFPNIASLTEGVKIDGLTQTTENADLKIVAGFIGNQPKIEKAIISMEGTASIFLLLNDNKILSHQIIDIKPSTLPGKKYPMRTRTERIQTKANLLSIVVQNELNDLKYLFNDQLELNLAFGMFKKVKKGNALLFNQKSKTLINSILEDPYNKQTLNEAESYWVSQLKSDFGKKVKIKSINKVIYSNLLSVAILQNDNNKMIECLGVLKDNVGLFDGWFARLKASYKIIEASKNLKSLEELPTITVTPEMVYKITINEKGLLKRKKKEIEFSKIVIQRFIPKIKSNIVSLNAVSKPKVYIYENDENTLIYYGDDKMHIKTKSGKEIIFKEENKVFKAYSKEKNLANPLL